MAEQVVILVDDSKHSLDVIAKMCEHLNIEYLTAANGVEGLKVIGEALSAGKEIACVFSDIEMPEMDGITFLQNIRADIKMREIPVVMCTVVTETEKVIAAGTHGISGYLLKPFDTKTFAKKIQPFLKRKLIL